MNKKEYLDYIEEWKKQNKDLIDSGKCRKVFLECLPRYTDGRYKGKINWKDSVGYNIYFVYNSIESYIVIKQYSITNKVLIAYKNIINEISTTSLNKNQIGRILNLHTKNFKVRIGQVFKDRKRNLVVIDRKCEKRKHGESIVNEKLYKYKCNKCGFQCGGHYDIKTTIKKQECWMVESDLLHGNGCVCCSNQIVVEGINDIPTTAPWMVKYFQGGYDEARLYTKYSNKKIYPVCPDCGRIKNKQININNIYGNKSIGCNCNDNIYYPEKLVFLILEQLSLNFKTQLTKLDFEWCDKYRYDFYFEYNNEKFIIETHGLQHYENCKGIYKDKLQEQQENDRLKKELALQNGIKEENYIVIDCRKSELEWVKCNVLNSRLNEIFDLSKIDWLKCEEFALSNLVKKACELWSKGINNTLKIGEIMKYNSNTICSWLKQGAKLGWCNYDVEKEKKQRNIEFWKKVEIFKEGVSLGVFPSISELERQSIKLFGVKLSHTCISLACNKKQKIYKDFTFKYVSNLAN